MTATQGNLAGLSRFIFRAPSWHATQLGALLIAAVVGVAAFDSEFILEDAWAGVFFVGIPTVVASLLTASVDRSFGGQLTRNRSGLLALFCELVVILILTAAGLFAHASRLSTVVPDFDRTFVIHALLVALAFIFALRLLVIVAVSRRSIPIAAIPASIQTLAAAILLGVYSGTTRAILDNPLLQAFFSRPEKSPVELTRMASSDFAVLAVMCVFYAVAVWLFIVVLDRPWRSSLGVSVLDFIQGFIGHIADGTRELEDFFEDLGEEALVPVTVLSVRPPGGEEKARFVLPMIHPGPMGEIGGGNLPKQIAREARGLGFPPHATAGHDFNLVTEREVDKILSAAETAYQRLEYSRKATPSVRVDEGDATLLGQGFGDAALVVTTFSPTFADDVDYAVGLSGASEARTGDIEVAMIVDAHNCNDGLEGGDLGHIVPGSPRSFDMIYGAGHVGELLADADRSDLRCGVAWEETDWVPREGIGPLGIRVAVFEVGGQTTAYAVIDGNNMVPGLRDRIVSEIDRVDHLEVMTTDTHVVNTVEAENQVGQAIDEDDLLAIVDDLVDRAIADLEPVEAGMATEKAEVTVFGTDRTEMLASTANAVVSLAAPLGAALILAVFAVSGLMFFLAG